MTKRNKERFPLTIKQCRVIQAVANQRSESDAGTTLNLTQSNISRTITAAEKSLGCKLFYRGWGGSDPTSEGEIIISDCNAIMKEIARVEILLSEDASSDPLLQPYLEWRHLQVLDALVNLGSASAAAEQLEQSQPAISRTIKAVETMVRQPLFIRRRLGMEPRKAARILVSLSNNILPRAMAMGKALETLPNNVTGRLCVGMLPFSSQDIVPHAFGILSNEFPHLRLQAMQAPYQMLVSAIQHREIDCFLGLMRKIPASSDLAEIPLLKAQYKLIARADHPVHQSAQTLADLVNYNWIVAPHGTPIRRYFEQLFDHIGSTPPVQTIEMLTLDSAEQMVLHSNAIALLVYDVKRTDDINPSLKLLDIELPNSNCTVGVTHRKGNDQPTFARFIEILKQIVSKQLSPAKR